MHNKLTNKSFQSLCSYTDDYSEKGNIMTHPYMAGDGGLSEANSVGQGQGDDASSQADFYRLKVFRRQRKAAITRHLGTLKVEWAMTVLTRSSIGLKSLRIPPLSLRQLTMHTLTLWPL